eukprot:TRINITY_DN7189_c0_g1_i1.p1 TRINITY_DN7189_c0_g1~~TRINITY_DN7189_c0_g1_i1.p1  ORF type:complete len:283 (+),score=33.39 TRINITY_DN7189_c0_g1_i1:263-1111(+)
MSRRRKVSFATADVAMDSCGEPSSSPARVETVVAALDRPAVNAPTKHPFGASLEASPGHVRSRSTRIRHQTGFYLKHAVVNQSLVTPTKPPRLTSSSSMEGEVFTPAHNHSWTRLASLTSASTNSSSHSIASVEQPSSPFSAPVSPDVSHVPMRCVRRWQSKHDLNSLPYYHGVLSFTDASRRLMQPGVSMGTFLLHFAPVEDQPWRVGNDTVQLTLSCLTRGQHMDTSVMHTVLLIDAYGVHLHQHKFADVPGLIQAARAQPLLDGCFLCGFVPRDWSNTA